MRIPPAACVRATGAGRAGRRRSGMKIMSVTARAESRRRAEPVSDALQTLDTHGACRITVATDEGIAGHGVISFGRLDRGPAVLARPAPAERRD